MSTEHGERNQRRLGRDDFLKLGAVTVGTGVLAACGAEGAPEPAAAPTGEDEPERPPIESEPGNLEVFEWAGYEYPAYGGKNGVLKPYVDQRGKPKFTFLTSDDQALGKVRAGYRPDMVHPCVDYVGNWIEMGVVQPWDTSLITNFPDLEAPLVQGGQVDGQQYFIPADWGFSSPLYRSDEVEPDGEESWALFYDDRYEGKISWWDSPLENFVIWGYVNGIENPWEMTDEQLDEARDFLMSKKHLCRNFWSSQTDLDADIAAGNIWIAYAWAGSYVAAKDAGLDVVYSEPKEGRLGWNCGFVLMADTENFRHAHEFVDAWSSVESAEWIINNYAYGHANTSVNLANVPEDYVAVFHLDDPEARQEPNAHYARPVSTERRAAYAQRWDEVKAS